MIRALIVLLVFPLWSNAYQKELITLPSNSDISILYVGDYMKGEIDINLMNKEWWGVFEDNKQSFIKKVEIKLEKIEPDIQYDWEYIFYSRFLKRNLISQVFIYFNLSV